MIGSKKRFLLILTTVLILMTGIMSTAYAANNAETVQAFPGIKVIYNGQELTGDKQPYIIDNTTYVPLRMLMNNFDKDISYDSASYQVIINDKANTAEAALNKKIEELNAEISTLQSAIKTLETENTKLKSENAALTTKNTTLTNRIAALEEDDELSDIEDELIEDYGDAGSTYFSDEDIVIGISLDGDEDDLEFEITLDFSGSDSKDDMTDLTKTKIKSLIKAIFDDIEEEIDDTDYEDADIEGTIEDGEGNTLEYDGTTYDFSW